MNRSELEYATHWNRKLKDAESEFEALLSFNVIGIVVDTGEGGLRPIRIERGGCSGTGSVSGIGWADDLQNALTAALHAVFQERIRQARTNLESVGVAVDNS